MKKQLHKTKLRFRSYSINLKQLFNKIPKTVIIAIYVFVIFIIIIALITLLSSVNKSDLFGGILIESYGMLFDILVIGIIILWLNEIRDRKLRRELEIRDKELRRELEMQRFLDEIEDFKGWESQEAIIRIRGNIKRLNRLKVTEIDLSRYYLKDADLSGLDLEKSMFEHTNLINANFKETNLKDVSFYHANLEGANLEDTNLEGVNFLGANLSKAILYSLIRHSYDLGFVSVAQLERAKSLYKAEIAPTILEELKEKCPELFRESAAEEPF